MSFLTSFSWPRRLGRWLVYEGFQLAFWVAFALRILGSLRSAFGGGGENGELRNGPAPVRPRRPGAGRRPVIAYPTAA